MAYPVYNTVSALAQNTTAKYFNNKGVLVVPGSSNASVVIKTYSNPGGGEEGDSITFAALANTSPYVIPI